MRRHAKVYEAQQLLKDKELDRGLVYQRHKEKSNFDKDNPTLSVEMYGSWSHQVPHERPRRPSAPITGVLSYPPYKHYGEIASPYCSTTPRAVASLPKLVGNLDSLQDVSSSTYKLEASEYMKKINANFGPPLNESRRSKTIK